MKKEMLLTALALLLAAGLLGCSSETPETTPQDTDVGETVEAVQEPVATELDVTEADVPESDEAEPDSTEPTEETPAEPAETADEPASTAAAETATEPAPAATAATAATTTTAVAAASTAGNTAGSGNSDFMTEEWRQSLIDMGVDPDKYTQPPKGNGYTPEELIAMGVLTESSSEPAPEPQLEPTEEPVQDNAVENDDVSTGGDFYIGNDGTITFLEPLPGGFGPYEYKHTNPDGTVETHVTP